MTTYESAIHDPAHTAGPSIPPNIANQLPSVNFGFEELRDRMSRFTLVFDDFIERGRKNILDDRNKFARDSADIKENQKLIKKNTDFYQQKEIEISKNSEKEAQEAQEAEREISQMASNKASKAAGQESLAKQCETLRAAIIKKRDKLAAERSALDAQAAHNAPELAFWEDYLGLRIEGAGKLNHIRFVFSGIDEKDPEREFEAVLSVEMRDYEIVGTRPRLGKEESEACIERLNETRSIPRFLKEVREEFVKLCN